MNKTPAIRELFEAALALPVGARGAFLDRHCDDRRLRGQVEALLHADGMQDDPAFGEEPGRLAQAIGDARPDSPPAGSRIGSFVLLRAIGEGGSSTVFEASREVEGVTQHVALKLLHQSLLGAEARRRFAREQRALVRLHHPNIARMIEGGVDGHGTAYIALELVDGMPITAYAQAHALDARERLALFLMVCKAVDAAHRALIVHRDLKPSNILVTVEGEVKLLDFGIAKLLADELDEQHTMLPAFTPAYAAPEQAGDGAITTATDVYALGVVVGELLTGTRPGRNVAGRTLSGPSGRGEAQWVPDGATTTRRRLRSDLDAVVAKAMDADPERRYASAGSLADEVARLLEGRPVQAQPQTRWYRARKFVSRHKGGVASTLAFVLAILASLGLAIWQAGVARREAARAHAENRFIAGLFDPLRTGVQHGEAPTVRQLLDAGVAQLNAQFAGDHAALADLAMLFSRVHVEIGAPDVAFELAGRAHVHARAAWGDDDPRTWVALSRRGEAAYHLDRYTEAVQDLEQAVAAMRGIRAHGDDLAFALQDLGLAYAKTGRAGEAVLAQRAAHDILKDSGDRIELATAMNNLGGAYLAAGDVEQSLQWRQRAYDWHVAHGLGENRAALVVLGNIARVKYGLGRWREALADLERLLPLRDRIEGGQLKRWSTTAQACSTAASLWELDKAQAHCERALVEAGQEPSPGRPRAIVLSFRAGVRMRQGDYAQARSDLQESRRILATVDGRNAGFLHGIELDRAEMARVAGTADDYIEVAAPLLPGPEGGDKPSGQSALLLAQFAWACSQARTPPPACGDDVASRAESLVATILEPGHPYRLPAVTALALRQVEGGDAVAAVARLRTELAAARPELGPDHPWMGEAQAALARAADASGDRELAAGSRAESARIAERLPPDHPLRRHLQVRDPGAVAAGRVDSAGG